MKEFWYQTTDWPVCGRDEKMMILACGLVVVQINSMDSDELAQC